MTLFYNFAFKGYYIFAEINNSIMRKTTLLAAAILGSVLLSCKKENNETAAATPAEPETKQYAELEKASWLIGSWGNTSKEGTLSENWVKANDSVYNGTTYFIAGKDTVFTENIRLEETNGRLAYITAVSDQNGGHPIRFEMTSGDDKMITFENPKHDFPQKIAYTKINNDSLVATISGMRDGKPAAETFAMKRQ
jgi:hypothetical protein